LSYVRVWYKWWRGAVIGGSPVGSLCLLCASSLGYVGISIICFWLQWSFKPSQLGNLVLYRFQTASPTVSYDRCCWNPLSRPGTVMTYSFLQIGLLWSNVEGKEPHRQLTCTEGFPFVVCSPAPSHWVPNRRLLVLYCNKRHTKWIASTCTRAQIKDPERVTSISMLQPYILVVASFGSLICAREREKKKGGYTLFQDWKVLSSV